MATNSLGNIGLPGNLYSGAAVTFNSQPYLNYFMQQQAHRQAQEDAMYRYIGDMGKNLTPAGMHTKDIPDLMKQKNEWQQFMMQNRKAVARPGLDKGAAYSEATSRYNNMLSLIAQSKNDAKNAMALKPILDSPQKRALLNDATMLRVKNSMLPVSDPNYSPFDPTTIDYNPPPFDAKQANALRNTLSQYKPTEGSPTIINLPNHQQQVTHNFKFDQGQLNGIYGQAVTMYHANPSFRNMIDSQASPDQYNALNQNFKEHYGKNINSQEDMAAAYMLGLHPDVSQKTEIRNVPYSPYETAAAGLGREKSYYQFRKDQEAKDAALLDDEAEKFLQGREQEGMQKGAEKIFNRQSGREEIAMPINLTPQQNQKMFSKRDITGKHIISADKVYKLEGGDYLPVYYQYKNGQIVKDKDGNPVIDDKYTDPVSRDAVKAGLISNKIVSKPMIHRPASSKPTTTIKKVTFGSGGLN